MGVFSPPWEYFNSSRKGIQDQIPNSVSARNEYEIEAFPTD
jgi:hypothetical protein